MDTSEWLWIAVCAFFLAAFIPRHHPVHPHILISNQRSSRGCLDNFYGDCFKRNHYRFSVSLGRQWCCEGDTLGCIAQLERRLLSKVVYII